jgi:hypothetical protein
MGFCIDILLVFIAIYNFNKRHLLLLEPTFILYIANMKVGELLCSCVEWASKVHSIILFTNLHHSGIYGFHLLLTVMIWWFPFEVSMIHETTFATVLCN